MSNVPQSQKYVAIQKLNYVNTKGETVPATVYGYGPTPEEAFKEVNASATRTIKHHPNTKRDGKPKVKLYSGNCLDV